MTYKPRLDGLRCVAIISVLFGHFLWLLSGFNFGIYGINLFFVLSGFLITSILLSQQGKKFGVSYKKFISRRALRIFPLYYFAIILLILLQVDNIKTDWPYLLSYTYNFRVGNLSPLKHSLAGHFVYGPYWSLSVEEQFYLLFPFIVLLLNNKRKWLLGLLLMIIIVAFLQRFYNILDMKTNPYENLVTNMFTLASGAVGAVLSKMDLLSKKIFNSFIIEIIAVAMLLYVLASKNEWLIYCCFPLLNLYLVLKGALFNFKVRIIDRLLTFKWSLFIGRISYGIYIYHLIVLYLFNKYIFEPLWNRIPFQSMGFWSKLKYNENLLKFPIVTLLVIFIAFLSYRYFESPILALKDKYFK